MTLPRKSDAGQAGRAEANQQPTKRARAAAARGAQRNAHLLGPPLAVDVDRVDDAQLAVPLVVRDDGVEAASLERAAARRARAELELAVRARAARARARAAQRDAVGRRVGLAEQRDL
jgi:hypothetical protein